MVCFGEVFVQFLIYMVLSWFYLNDQGEPSVLLVRPEV